MRLLIYEWNFLTKRDLYDGFNALGVEFEIFRTNIERKDDNTREQFRKELKKYIDIRRFDALFSINYQSEMAEVAHELDILYICWTYDSPSVVGDVDIMKYETNRIFIFDSKEYKDRLNADIKHVYYLPLAAGYKRFSSFKPTPMQQLKYGCDISLVGQLYQSDMDMIYPLFDEYSAGFVASLINTQLQVYGRTIMHELLNEKVLKRVCNPDVENALINVSNKDWIKNVDEVNAGRLSMWLLKAVTNKERVLLLTMLSKNHRVNLCARPGEHVEGVKTVGTVDYDTEMPIVFKCSKINLNITLRAIEKAVPQRVFDILGCRALALTNYQADLDELFEDGKHLLIYHSIEEALDKAKYYLDHDKEAELIRQNGYKIIKDQFSYEHQIKRMMEISGLSI